MFRGGVEESFFVACDLELAAALGEDSHRSSELLHIRDEPLAISTAAPPSSAEEFPADTERVPPAPSPEPTLAETAPPEPDADEPLPRENGENGEEETVEVAREA